MDATTLAPPAPPARSARRSELRPTAAELVDGAAVVALTAVALSAFQSSYGGTQYLVIGIVGALIGVVSTAVSSRAGLPVVAVVAVWLVLYATVGGAVALRADAVAGVVPTPATATGALGAVVTGWKQLLTTVPPVGATGDLLALPMLCGLLAAGTSFLLARRTALRLVPSLPPFVVLCLGILFGTNEPVSVLLHGGVFGAGAVAWAAWRQRRTRDHTGLAGTSAHRVVGAVGLLAAATAVGFAARDSVPLVDAGDRTIWRDTTDPPFDPNDFPSPLNGYRRYVKLLEDEVLFTVEGLPQDAPIRMTTLDAYDGVVWRLEGGERAEPGGAAYFERVGTDVQPDFEGEEIDVTVTIPEDSAYREVWVPTVGEVRSISFDGPRARRLAEQFRYSRFTDAAALSRLALQPGDSYTMRVTVPVSITDVADEAPVLAVELPEIETIGADVGGLGSGLLEEESSPIRRTVALAEFLEQSGYYSDGKEGQAQSLAGHGAGRLDQFARADALVGNAEQYAAALGLMLRNQEIPARVVVGFLPREWDDGPIDIRGTDAEAWVEVPIDGIGWVAVDSTPDRSRTSVDQRRAPRPIPDRETQVPPPPVVLEPDAETDPASESEQTQRRRRDPAPEEDETTDDGIPLVAIIGVAAVGLPLLLLGVPLLLIVWRKRRRRARRRRSGTTDARIANGWNELVDFAIDAGRPVPSTATRREAAQFVGAPEAPALARQADGAVFGPADPTDDEVEAYWSELEQLLRSMRSELSITERVRTRINTASLRRGRRGREHR